MSKAQLIEEIVRKITFIQDKYADYDEIEEAKKYGFIHEKEKT